MLPLSNIPLVQNLTQPPPALNTSVVLPVPAQAANNLVYYAVPANTAPVSLNNNVRGGSPTQALPARAAQEISPSVPVTSFAPNRGEVNTPEGHNSRFLAQALSQHDAGNQNALFLEYEPESGQAPLEQAEAAQAPEPSPVARYIEVAAQHLTSLQRVSIKAYQQTVARNAVMFNQQTLLSVARSV